MEDTKPSWSNSMLAESCTGLDDAACSSWGDRSSLFQYEHRPVAADQILAIKKLGSTAPPAASLPWGSCPARSADRPRSLMPRRKLCAARSAVIDGIGNQPQDARAVRGEIIAHAVDGEVIPRRLPAIHAAAAVRLCQLQRRLDSQGRDTHRSAASARRAGWAWSCRSRPFRGRQDSRRRENHVRVKSWTYACARNSGTTLRRCRPRAKTARPWAAGVLRPDSPRRRKPPRPHHCA